MLTFSLCYGLPGKQRFLRFIHKHFYKALTDLQDWVDAFLFSAPYIEYYHIAYYIYCICLFSCICPYQFYCEKNEGWNSILLQFVFLALFLKQIGRQ